jgi:hypothetical protein
MSISNRHQVVPFVAGKSEPMTQQRLAKIGYKNTSKTPAKFPSVCVSVPFIDALTFEQFQRIATHVGSMLENAQDGIIRSLYESSDGKITEIADTDIDFDACVSYLDTAARGDRMTKEYLEQWFDSQVRDNLFVVIADKLGFSDITPEVEVTVEKHLAGYKVLISSLAGGKTILKPNQITAVQKALALASVDDDVSLKLNARLVAMAAKPKIEDLLEL